MLSTAHGLNLFLFSYSPQAVNDFTLLNGWKKTPKADCFVAWELYEIEISVFIDTFEQDTVTNCYGYSHGVVAE